MKNNSFDLTGKAIDCTGVSEIVFNTLKRVCRGMDDGSSVSQFNNLPEFYQLEISNYGRFFLSFNSSLDDHKEILKPIDVLGEPLMKAIELGYTPVFEGDKVPGGAQLVYKGGSLKSLTTFEPFVIIVDENVIAYKTYDASDLDKCFKGILPREPFPETSIEFGPLIKLNFDELKHFDDDTVKWKEREKETYTDNDEKIESLARDLFVRYTHDTEGDYSRIAEESWKAAREFYKVKS